MHISVIELTIVVDELAEQVILLQQRFQNSSVPKCTRFVLFFKSHVTVSLISTSNISALKTDRQRHNLFAGCPRSLSHRNNHRKTYGKTIDEFSKSKLKDMVENCATARYLGYLRVAFPSWNSFIVLFILIVLLLIASISFVSLFPPSASAEIRPSSFPGYICHSLKSVQHAGQKTKEQTKTEERGTSWCCRRDISGQADPSFSRTSRRCS
jgi:hypothetical protein